MEEGILWVCEVHFMLRGWLVLWVLVYGVCSMLSNFLHLEVIIWYGALGVVDSWLLFIFVFVFVVFIFVVDIDLRLCSSKFLINGFDLICVPNSNLLFLELSGICLNLGDNEHNIGFLLLLLRQHILFVASEEYIEYIGVGVCVLV